MISTPAIRCIFVCLALFFLHPPLRLNAAAQRTPDGRDIYRRQCVKCHGRAGEGVKGKYDDALHGDWSVEKLARYITKNMPEDAPGTCVGPDAEAVARHINDTFYSREARARAHPPRVELVHLTNRQYINTAADLLRHFLPADGPPGSEHGLRANYRPRNRKDAEERKSFERVDRQVHWAYATNSPDAERLGPGTNEFSIHWRGSVRAEETGDYEFLIKTPNGARLWVNDDETPMIDAGVASGKIVEHKAMVRLLGGRSYPLRLEYFKAAKDKMASIALCWRAPFGVEEVIPARCLSPARVAPTFVVTTPFPPDDSSVGYERGVAVSKAWDDATTRAAIEMANYVVKNIENLSQNSSRRDEAEPRSRTRERPRSGTNIVSANSTNRAVKLEAFCAEFVATAFRRPLTTGEKRLFVTAQFQKATQWEDAVKRVVLLALKSPHFLYLGLEGGERADFAAAARLSFGLWDSLPDRELITRATAHEVQTREQIAGQAQRMLGDSRARAKMQYFLHQWLQMGRFESLAKDDKLFPGFTPEIVADLRTSLNLFLDDVVWSKGSDYRRLLLEEDLFLNNRLASYYGVNTNETDDFFEVNFDPAQRSGVITHPYLLAAFSYQKFTSPIHRGVFLTRNIVGRALKPPPMAVAFKEADFAPHLTMREKIAELTRPQNCQSCHSVINPLGFSLEHYDAVGRFRTQEGDRPIDATSEYPTDEGGKVRLTGARDVAEFAVGSEHAHNAFIEQLFHQVTKQPMAAYGTNTADHLRQSFHASGFNLQNLLVDIVTISALHETGKPSR